MQTVIAAALCAIAAVLFYKVVERRHKIMLAKVVGVLAGLAVLAVAALAFVDARASRARTVLRDAISIRFVAAVRDTTRYRPENPFADLIPPSSVQFEFCNSGSDTIAKVTFRPKTLQRGRSTEYDLINDPGASYMERELSSDYVLPPGACHSESWWRQRGFNVLDSVVARSVRVRRVGDLVLD